MSSTDLPSGAPNGANGAAPASSPAARRIYLAGSRSDIRVPMREISLQPTRGFDGRLTPNDAVRVYDTSGPWGESSFHQDPTRGLPPVRSEWIRERGDVEEYTGRAVQPIDDGYLSAAHARQMENPNSKSQTPTFQRRRPLRARSGAATQLAYARRGIVTPEMEFVAIRENMKLQAAGGALETSPDAPRDSLQSHRVAGQ